ncbi:MAG: hypothetical protein AAGH65_12065 [Pseudomonadota bacterium]
MLEPMPALTASAPGKILLSGEYAVLRGAPALACAVDRSVRVSVRTAAGAIGTLRATPLARGRFEFDPSLQAFWLDPDQAEKRLGLTSRLLPDLYTALLSKADPLLDIEIDSAELFEPIGDRRIKLGLGSSAAVAVALNRALLRWSGQSQPRPKVELQALLPRYRRCLGSEASGADLATSVYGGLNVIQSDAGAIEVQPMRWPEGLHWRVIWTGAAAQTTDYVQRFLNWMDHSQAADDCMYALLRTAQDVITACQYGSSTDLCGALNQYFQQLMRMDRSMIALDSSPARILTSSHRQLAQRAQQQGVAYKTLGAGGGDLGLAYGLDYEALAQFCDGLSAGGPSPLELRMTLP